MMDCPHCFLPKPHTHPGQEPQPRPMRQVATIEYVTLYQCDECKRVEAEIEIKTATRDEPSRWRKTWG